MSINTRNTTSGAGNTGPLRPSSGSGAPAPVANGAGKGVSSPNPKDVSRTDARASARLKALGRFDSLPGLLGDLGRRISDQKAAISRSESALKGLQGMRPGALGRGAGRPQVTSITSRLQAQIADQKKTLQTLEADRTKLLAERADDRPDGKVDAGHTRALAEIAKLDGPIGKAQGDKAAAESKLEGLTKKKLEEFGKSSGVRGEQARLQGQIAEKKGAVDAARKEIAGLGENSAQLRKQNDGLKVENKKLFDQEQAKGAERRKLLGQQAADQPLYDALKTFPAGSLTDGDKTFLADFDRRAGSIKTLSDDISRLNEKQAANDATIGKNEQTVRSNDTKVSGLRESITKSEGELKGLEGQLADVNKRLAAFDQQAKALDGQIAAATGEVKKLGDQLVGLQNQRTKAVQGARGVEAQDVRLGEAQVERLDKEIGTVKGQLESAKSKLASLVTQRDQLRSDADRLGKEAGALKGSIDRLKQEQSGARSTLEANQKTLGGLEAENAKLFGQEQQLGKERQGLLRQIAEDGPLAEALKNLEPDLLTEDDRKFIAGFDAAKARVEAIGKEVAALNEKQDANSGKIGELKTANEGLQKRIAELEASIKSESSKLAGVEKSLQETNGKIAGLDKEIAATQKSIDQLQQKLSGLESERGKWVGELEQDRKEMAELK